MAEPDPGRDFVVGLAAELAAQLVVAGLAGVRRALATDDQAAALSAVASQALAKVLSKHLSSIDQELTDHVAELLGSFFSDPSVAAAMLDVALEGSSPAPALADWFDEAGFDASTLPLRFEVLEKDFVRAWADELAQEAARPNSPLTEFVNLRSLLNLCQRLATFEADFAARMARLDRALGIPTSSRTEILERLEQMTTAIRRFVHPKTLPLINRGVVEHDILRVLREPPSGGTTLVFLVGPAGYGKSTALAQLFDDLTQSDLLVPCLIRSTDVAVSSSPGDLDIGFGVAATGREERLSAIHQDVRHSDVRWVFLIDTLDLILSTDLVPALKANLTALLDDGASVVITSRDYEFRSILEPRAEKLLGLNPLIQFFELGAFTPAEARRAASAYFVNNNPDASATEAADFGEAIMNLSADNRPLREIVLSPLLLAMTCELFGHLHQIPEDLTTTKLYGSYWELKVSQSRRYPRLSEVTRAKERIALTLALKLWHASEDALVDRWAVHSLDGTALPHEVDALNDLMSEHVLLETGGQVEFFHQSYLEFAIALALVRNPVEFNGLIHTLKGASSPIFIWPVVRQVLVLAELHDYQRLLKVLDDTDLSAFRTLALSAAARRDSQRLEHLTEVALNEPHQWGLFEAELVSAVEQWTGSWDAEMWRVILRLLRGGGVTTASRLSQQMRVFAADAQEVPSRVVDAVDALFSNASIAEQGRRTRGAVQTALGFVASFALEWLADNRSPLLTDFLIERYLDFGRPTQARILELASKNAPSQQDEALEVALNKPLDAQLKPAAAELLTVALPRWVGGVDARWDSWRAALRATAPEGWTGAISMAIGTLAARDSALLHQLLWPILAGDPTAHVELDAVLGAIAAGAASEVAHWLDGLDPNDVSVSGTEMAALVAGNIARVARCDREELQRLYDWTRRFFAENYPGLLYVLPHLAEQHPETIDIMVRILRDAERETLPRLLSRVLRGAPATVGVAIARQMRDVLKNQRQDVPAQLALCEILRLEGVENGGDVGDLIRLAMAQSDRVARSAASALAQVFKARRDLDISDLLPLATSSVPGVRTTYADIVHHSVRRGLVSPEGFAGVLEATRAEVLPSVLIPLSQAVIAWNEAGREMTVADVSHFGTHVLSNPDVAIGRGTSGWLLGALGAIAFDQSEVVLPLIARKTAVLAEKADVGRIGDGPVKMTRLLTLLARHDPSIIHELRHRQPSLSPANRQALEIAARQVGA